MPTVTGKRAFTGVPESVPAARRFVREALEGHPREVRDAAELMTSELATNSVRHAHSAFEVIVSAGGTVRVEVRDSGVGKPTLQTPTITSSSGRGLHLVSRMADDWGTVERAGGNTVWFTLSEPAA